jgi:hypothetical protein
LEEIPVYKSVLALLLLTGAAQAATVYSVDYRTDQFISFDTATPGTVNVLGAQSDAIYGMDFNTAGTILYAANSTTGQLGTLNLATGAFTAIGALTGLNPADNVTGLSMNPIDNVMRLMSANVEGSTLYTVNLATGALTTVGSTPGLMIDLAFNGAGALYSINIVDDNLYSIDPLTGAGTLIGPTGYGLNFAQGMDFDPATGILFAALYQGGGVNTFASINTATGAATSLAAMTGREMEMAIQPAQAAVPEPSTLALMLAPLALGAWLRKRRQ